MDAFHQVVSPSKEAANSSRPRRESIRGRLLRQPRFVKWGIFVDRIPEEILLALLLAAMWPTWVWMCQRVVDRSDDPFGLLALGALGVLCWHHRRALRAAPNLGCVALALFGVMIATVAQGWLPPLLVGLVSLLTLAIGLIGFLPKSVPTMPVIGLSVLSLPLLASLQFYAGYPLRVITAEASRTLLSVSHVVERAGASLMVDGQLVIVDAPCSGVQMAWLGYFTACVVALYFSRSNRSFLSRLPLVGLLVLSGNIVRNTVLVALEASGESIPGWSHDGIGLTALAAVCGSIVCVMAREERRYRIA